MPKTIYLLILYCLYSIHALSQAVHHTTSLPENSYYEMALDLYYEQHYAETIDLTQQIVSKNPGHYEAFLLRGMAKEKLEDPQGALTDYSITLHIHPAYKEALFRRALLQFQISNYTQAVRDFKLLLRHPLTETQAVFFKGNNDQAAFQTEAVTTLQSDMRADFYNYLGLSYLYLDNLSEAVSYLDSAIALQPKQASFFNNRGMTHERKGDLQNALEDYKQALAIDPGHQQALQNLTALAYKAGKEDILEATLNNAVHASSSATSYLQRGILKQRKGLHKEAIIDFDSALFIAPTEPDPYLFKAYSEEKSII